MRLRDEESSLLLVILDAVMDQHDDTVCSQTSCDLLGIPWKLHHEMGHVAQDTSDCNQYDLDVHPHGRLFEIVLVQKLKEIKTRKH